MRSWDTRFDLYDLKGAIRQNADNGYRPKLETLTQTRKVQVENYKQITGKINDEQFDVGDIALMINTLSGQKYLNTVKYTCTNCVIYRLYNQLYIKMRIDIYKYRKYVSLALTSMKSLQFLVFHEVLIY